jgi:hypothetical protein
MWPFFSPVVLARVPGGHFLEAYRFLETASRRTS